MVDSFIQLSPDSTGKKVDTRTAPDGDHREVLVVGSPTTADVAEADATNGLDVDVTRVQGTVAVSAAALPLPSGASTAALQTTLNGHVDGIEGLLTTIDADTGVVAGAVSGSEMQVDVVAALPAGSNNIGDVDIASLPNEGQQNMAGSISVAIASDQSTVPVSLAAAPLPSGAATEAKQDTQITHLATIAGDTTDIEAAVEIMDDWDESDRAKVNVIVGQAGVAAGAGAVGATVQRVTLASDDPAVAALQILDNAIAGSEMQVDVVGALPAGTNNIGDVDVLSVIPGTGATNLGKAVDSIPGATDTGVAALVVRDDSLATLTPADGDYTHLRTDSTGALWVRSTSAAGGTSATDEDAFTAGTSTGTPVMGAFDDASPDTLTEGDLGIIRATTNRALHVNLRDAAGAELAVGGGTQYTEDAAAAANPVGTALNLIRADALAGLTTTDGDNVAARGTDKGELYVKHVDAIPVTDNGGALTVDNGGTFAVQDATAQASLSVIDDWDESDRAKVNPIVGQAGVQGASGVVTALTQRVVLATDVALPAGTNNIGDVDVLTLPALVAGTANIGDVDVLTMPVTEVVGDVAADAAVPANPLAVGGRASTAVPTAVSADGDSVYAWLNRLGMQVVSAIPGLGLNADPLTLLSETAQYTTTQTSAVLVTGGASERIVVTSIQIQVGGTTAGTLQVYFGTGAYSRGTDEAIFDGEFAPSATLKPGFFAAPPAGFRAGALGDDVLVTTSAGINPLTITVWYYVLGT